jgi:hypothetical protein
LVVLEESYESKVDQAYTQSLFHTDEMQRVLPGNGSGANCIGWALKEGMGSGKLGLAAFSQCWVFCCFLLFFLFGQTTKN